MEALAEIADQLAEVEAQDRIFRIQLARDIRAAAAHWALPDPHVETLRHWADRIEWGRPN